MSKQTVKKAGVAAFEGTLRALTPDMQQLFETLVRQMGEVRGDVRGLENRIDRAVDQLKLEFQQQLGAAREQLVSLNNELHQRIAHMEGEVKALSSSINNQSARMIDSSTRLRS
jgi:hypothetical protein